MPKFRAAADLLLPRLGPAEQSHPEEYAAIMSELSEAGVEVVYRHGTLAYGPRIGAPGQLILDGVFSIAALRHEYQHYLDDRDNGYPGLGTYFDDPKLYATLEVRAYLREVDTARETGHAGVVAGILMQMRTRVREILGGP